MANQIIKLSPASGHFQLGNIYVSEKNITAAEKEFSEMVKLDPAYTSALANFYVGQKEYDKAFALFEEELKKNPENFLTMYQIGRASATTGQRLERGEECLKKYLLYTPRQNEPSHAGANMRLAQIIERKGNKAEAKRLFEAALKLDGTLKEAQEGLQRTSK
jgi:tetratricopeptide (TPR) repeat protein